METIWIMLLGAIQGATEFLPVSSSGHLAAGQMALSRYTTGVNLSDKPLVLEIVLHLATLLAVIVIYRLDVWRAITGALRALKGLTDRSVKSVLTTDDGANLAMCIIIGTIPTGVIGLLLKDSASTISQSPKGLGLTFLACSALLLATRWWPGGSKKLTWKTALLIGIVQGLAVLPGISRSGATIATALALGLKREEAARFSFMLSIPAIAGAAAMELDVEAMTISGKTAAFALGGIVAFLVGLVALVTLIRLVRGGRLWLFAPYVAAMGFVTIFLLG